MVTVEDVGLVVSHWKLAKPDASVCVLAVSPVAPAGSTQVLGAGAGDGGDVEARARFGVTDARVRGEVGRAAHGDRRRTQLEGGIAQRLLQQREVGLPVDVGRGDVEGLAVVGEHVRAETTSTG